MQVIDPCCCGLDIHKKFVVACVLTTADDGQVKHHDRRPARAARWADRQRLHACRHGEYEQLLAAGVEPAGGAADAVGGERVPRQNGPGTIPLMEVWMG